MSSNIFVDFVDEKMIFVDNQQITLQSVFIDCIKWAEEVDIAVAFLRKSGVDLIYQPLINMLNRGGKLRIVVGKDFGYTQPEALSIMENIGGSIKVYIGSTIFHPKSYHFRKPGKMIVILGSSNMTASGLHTGVEWNIVLDDSEINLSEVASSFEKLWLSENTQTLSPNLIKELKRHQKETKSEVKQQAILRKLDLSFQNVIFTRKIGKSFLNPRGKYQHCINIPKKYHRTLNQHQNIRNYKGVIVSPDGNNVEGYIRRGTTRGSMYYQINISRKQFESISSEFQMGKKIWVEIRLYSNSIEVYLSTWIKQSVV